MSVVIETTLGDITVDLYLKERPRASLNFLKLCKIKYYNFNLFHTISRGFIAQTGDPTGSRTGGESVFGVIDGSSKRYFEAENEPRIKHTRPGLVSFVGGEDNMIGSQFFLTLGENLTYLDEKHCVFGEVVEGYDILEMINEVICDTDDRPYQDVRITHTVVLDDPFPDPKHLKIPSRSPSPSAARLAGGRIAPDEEIDETSGRSAKEIAEMQAEREAKARATILEMVGDIPDAEMAPPENVLFVCKLNPVTTDDDLEIIFSRFGKIKSCEVIRDRKTGDSLQYAFIEFGEQKSCEDAYFKMGNVLIDDRRIHVDFSQSVSKVKWLGKGRGVAHYDEQGNKKRTDATNDVGRGNYKSKNGVKEKDNDRRTPRESSRIRSKSPRDRNTKKYGRRDRSPEKDKRNRSPRTVRRKSNSPKRQSRSRNSKERRRTVTPSSDNYESRRRSPLPAKRSSRCPSDGSEKQKDKVASYRRQSNSPRLSYSGNKKRSPSYNRRKPSPRRRSPSPKRIRKTPPTRDGTEELRERAKVGRYENKNRDRSPVHENRRKHGEIVRKYSKSSRNENSEFTEIRNTSSKRSRSPSRRSISSNIDYSSLTSKNEPPKQALRGKEEKRRKSRSVDRNSGGTKRTKEKELELKANTESASKSTSRKPASSDESETEDNKPMKKKRKKKAQVSSDSSSSESDSSSSSEDEKIRRKSKKSKAGRKIKMKRKKKTKNKRKKYSSSSESSSSESESTSSESSSSSSESDKGRKKKHSKKKRTKSSSESD